jgi:hypothetical protein
VGHILPLRRFLENCLNTDLRSFYAGNLSFKDKRLSQRSKEGQKVSCPVVSGPESENSTPKLLELVGVGYMFTEAPPRPEHLEIWSNMSFPKS